MPVRPPKPCRKCKRATSNSNDYCDAHQVDAVGWAKSQAGKTTTQRGYGYKWQKTRERILSRDQHLCVPCRKQGVYSPAKDVDHIVNKANGGSDEDDNLQSICFLCHKAKTLRESRG